METAKKAANGRRGNVVHIGVNNGRGGIKPEVVKARRNEVTWDVRWFNFQTNEWEREGDRLTYRQAYNRAYAQGKANPYAKIGVCLVTGRRPKALSNGSAPTESASA